MRLPVDKQQKRGESSACQKSSREYGVLQICHLQLASRVSPLPHMSERLVPCLRKEDLVRYAGRALNFSRPIPSFTAIMRPKSRQNPHPLIPDTNIAIM